MVAGGALQQGFADSDEVASFGDEVLANRLFRTRGLQGNCIGGHQQSVALRSGQWAADALGSVDVSS